MWLRQPQPLIPCPLCGKKFLTKRRLSKHVTETHTEKITTSLTYNENSEKGCSSIKPKRKFVKSMKNKSIPKRKKEEQILLDNKVFLSYVDQESGNFRKFSLTKEYHVVIKKNGERNIRFRKLV